MRQPLVFSDFIIDLNTFSVKVGDRVTYLSRREFDLLTYFIKNKGVPVTYYAIDAGIPNWFITIKTLYVYVSRLRAIVGRHHIQNVRGIGFVFKDEPKKEVMTA